MSDLNPVPEFEEKVRMAVDVPNANPEFVNQLRNDLARRPVRMKSRFIVRPVWGLAFVLALIVIWVSVSGVASAIGRIIGYVPNVGLVENTGDLRILDQSYAMTREGVTLTINYVLVDKDHVEVIYDVQGIPAENDGWQASDSATNPKAFCGGVEVGDTYNKEGDPILKLPDGTLLERDLTGKYPQNVFAMKPVYEAKVPANVLEMTFMLKCIPNARLGVEPENWEVPIKLKTVPADMVLGSPVIEVEQTAVASITEPVAASSTKSPALPAPVVNMTLEKVVPFDSGVVFYIRFDVENKDLSLISIMPVTVYMIDSQGQKSRLVGNYILQPYEHRTGSLFEFTSQSKPADGPLTVLVENAVAYYAPLYTDPPQATLEEMSFSFDAGANPQHGQVWDLNKEFEIAGYPLKIISAKAVTWDDVKRPDFILGSQGLEHGYQFTVESDSSLKMSVEVDMMAESPVCMKTGVPFPPESSSLLYTQLCRTYPSGNVQVRIRELSVLLENTWQVTWTP